MQSLPTRRAPVILALVASLTAAGCLQGAEPGVDASTTGPLPPDFALDWALNAIPFGDGHDHADYAHHQNLSTPNFRVIGWNPLESDVLGTTPTGMGCGGIGTPDGERRIAVVHTFSTDVAFVVADVTDPTNPVKLGEYVLENIHAWDATVTPDGRHVLIGAYPPVLKPGWSPGPPGTDVLGALDTVVVQPKWRDACTGEERAAGPEQSLPLAPAIIMVGISDPENPVLEDFVPQPILGPHSVSSALIDGTLYAMSSVTNLVHEASYYSFFEIVGTPTGGAVLEPLSTIEAPGVASPALNGHVDVEMQKHPITGQVLAYLANWDEGLAVYDMTNPRVPMPVSTWKDGTRGAIHETMPFDVLWNGTHYTLIGQEVGEPVDLPSGIVYILDTTDPANPVEVGRWTLPMKPKWDGGLQFSTHYLEVVNRTMFVTNYHGGLWAVDISDPSQPGAVGLFVPDRAPPKPHPRQGGPVVADVLAWEDGILTVWDGSGGIYQLRFDDSNPAPKPEPWDLG